jgi:uncharacterized protein (DUF4415 family)
MSITFDPAKDAINKKKHKISLARAEYFDFGAAIYTVDDREDYGEVRYRALSFLDARLYSLAFVLDGKTFGRSACARRQNMKKKSTKRAGKTAVDSANDNPEWTRKDFARAVPIGGLPARVQRALRKRGPQKAPKKVPISIRISPDVAEGLRATGAGWQRRADDALRSWLATARN